MIPFYKQLSNLGRDQHIDFSNLEVAGYIPQIREPSLAYPLIACDIDEIPQSLLGFHVPDESIDNYNVIFDVPYEGMKRTKIQSSTREVTLLSEHESYEVTTKYQSAVERPIFDIVKHWPYGSK